MIPDTIEPIRRSGPLDHSAVLNNKNIDQQKMDSNESSTYYGSSLKSYRADVDQNQEKIKKEETSLAAQENAAKSLFTWMVTSYAWIWSFFSKGTAPVEASQTSDDKTTSIPNRPVLAPADHAAMDKVLKEMKEVNKQTQKTNEEHLDSQNDSKAFVAILMLLVASLKKQADIRQKVSLDSKDKVFELQEDVQKLHEQRMKLNKEINELGKRLGISGTISTFLNGASIVVTGYVLIAGAATLATGGALSPLLAIPGALANLARAGNTAYKGYYEHKLENHRAESFVKNEKEDLVKFQITVSLDEMKIAMNAVKDNWETLSKILRNQSETIQSLKNT